MVSPISKSLSNLLEIFTFSPADFSVVTHRFMEDPKKSIQKLSGGRYKPYRYMEYIDYIVEIYNGVLELYQPSAGFGTQFSVFIF